MRTCPSTPAALWALIPLLLVSCGDTAESLPRMEGERVLYSLIAESERLTIVSENPEHPIKPSVLVPRAKGERDTGPLPSLRMSPPAEARFELPAGADGARLHLTTGADGEAYARPGSRRVRFEVELDGEKLVDEIRMIGAEAGRDTYPWHRFSFDASRGGELVLRTSCEDGAELAAEVGFGLLEVTVPLQVHRQRASNEHPNVIFVVIDTLRADRLSVYGNERETTPVLDALANRGTLFETAYSATPWTWPSTASLLTSRSPPEHGLLDVDSCYLAHDLDTIAEVFQSSGMTTAAFSCNPLVTSDKNFDQGFERFEEYEWARTEDVIEDVLPWLDEFGEYRFFLYLHLADPHAPYEPPADLASIHAGDEPEGYSDAACKPLLAAAAAGEPHDEELLARFLDHRVGLYDGEIASTDRGLGRLFQALRDSGLEEKTLIAVTSDHGEEFAEHGMLGHGKQLYDESLRVPLILAGPGVPRGVRVGGPVENRFLGTTLARLAGVVSSLGSERSDLLEPPREGSPTSRPLFFTVERGQAIDRESGERIRLQGLHAVEQGRMRFFWSADASSGGAFQALFDLERDPGALRDLAPERPEDAARMRAMIEAWWEAGLEVRPPSLHGGSAALELLQGIGYIGEN